MIIERTCRLAALLIAILAVIDPTWISAETMRPTIAVVRTDGADDRDVARVTETLARTFALVPADLPDVAARVMVGRVVPGAPMADGPVFVVEPSPRINAPEVRQVRVPDRVNLQSVARVVVDVAYPPSVAAGALHLSLRADEVPIDEQTVEVAANALAGQAQLTFVPARTGVSRLRVSARFDGGPEVVADAAVEVVERRLRVLIHEGRPTWSSTFLRRLLEADPRFEVTVRSMVSRGVSADAGAPPSTLDRAEDLAGVDLVILSSPDAVSDRAADALVAYLRTREGAVLVLPDAAASPVLSRLTGVPSWNPERRPALESVASRMGDWSASEFLWPATWPAGAFPLTSCLAPRGTERRCAVWRVPVGGGRVVVSSALDGWRTRSADGSGFEGFWRALIGDEAAATPAAIDVSLSSRLIEAGSTISAEIRVHDHGQVPVAEWQATDGASQAVRLWPEGAGVYGAEFRAPDVPGRYRLRVTAEDTSVSEFAVVDAGGRARVRPATQELLRARATSSGGAMVTMADVETLADQIRASVPATVRDVPKQPMRSPWWIVPFASVLAIEWWSRRRRGER